MTLWHTALWYTALWYTALWHTALGHTALWHTALWYMALWYTAFWYTALRYMALWYTALWYTALWYTALWYTALWYTALWYTALWYTALWYTALWYTALWYTALWYTALWYTALWYTALWYTATLAHGTQHPTPSVVHDLFQDLCDGHQLLDLLEVLSGHQLVKLVNINVPDVVAGKPTVVLGLVWSIIRHFQMENLTLGLPRDPSERHLVPDVTSSPTGTPPLKRGRFQWQWGGSARQALLHWAQDKARGTPVPIRDFGVSWRDGRAFAALVNSLHPGVLPPTQLQPSSPAHTLNIIFTTAENILGIPRLLEPHDLTVENPDEKSIMTYVSQFLGLSRQLPAGVHVTEEALGAPWAEGREHPEVQANVRQDFEDARREMEGCIEGAVSFLQDQGSPQQLLAKHQETIQRFESGVLQRFLDSTHHMQTLLTPDSSLMVADQQEDLCRKWTVRPPTQGGPDHRLQERCCQLVQTDISAHVQWLREEVERRKSSVVPRAAGSPAWPGTQSDQSALTLPQRFTTPCVCQAGVLGDVEQSVVTWGESGPVSRDGGGRGVRGEPALTALWEAAAPEAGEPLWMVGYREQRRTGPAEGSGGPVWDVMSLSPVPSAMEKEIAVDGAAGREQGAGTVNLGPPTPAVIHPVGTGTPGAVEDLSGQSGEDATMNKPSQGHHPTLGEHQRDKDRHIPCGSAQLPAPGDTPFPSGDWDGQRAPSPESSGWRELLPVARAPPEQMSQDRRYPGQEMVLSPPAGEDGAGTPGVSSEGQWGAEAAGDQREDITTISAGERRQELRQEAALAVGEARRAVGWAEGQLARGGDIEVPGGWHDLPVNVRLGEAGGRVSRPAKASVTREMEGLGAGQGPEALTPTERVYPGETAREESQEQGVGISLAGPLRPWQSHSLAPERHREDQGPPLGPGSEDGGESDQGEGRHPLAWSSVPEYGWPGGRSAPPANIPEIQQEQVGEASGEVLPGLWTTTICQGNQGVRDDIGETPADPWKATTCQDNEEVVDNVDEKSPDPHLAYVGQGNDEVGDNIGEKLPDLWAPTMGQGNKGVRSHVDEIPTDPCKASMGQGNKGVRSHVDEILPDTWKATMSPGNKGVGDNVGKIPPDPWKATTDQGHQDIRDVGETSSDPWKETKGQGNDGVEHNIGETPPSLWATTTGQGHQGARHLIPGTASLYRRDMELDIIPQRAVIPASEMGMEVMDGSSEELGGERPAQSVGLVPRSRPTPECSQPPRESPDTGHVTHHPARDDSGTPAVTAEQAAWAEVTPGLSLPSTETMGGPEKAGTDPDVEHSAREELELLEGAPQHSRSAALEEEALSQLKKALETTGIQADGRSGHALSCWDLVEPLGCAAEDAGLQGGQQERMVQEELLARQSRLVGSLRDIGERAGAVPLTEATLPAVQARLGSLVELELNVQREAKELQGLREQADRLLGSSLAREAQERLRKAEEMWGVTAGEIQDRKDQCFVIMAFLREFQSHKKDLRSTIGKGERLIQQHASYMGKERLGQLLTEIEEVKCEFGTKQEQLDGLRKICQHLHSELRPFVDTGSLPFQREVDELVDRWLDVTEWLQSYGCSLQQALRLWDELRECGCSGWAARRRLVPLGEGAVLEDQIHGQEQQNRRFLEKAVRIQELLRWEEVPLELQVMESAARGELEQMKHRRRQLVDRGGGTAQGPETTLGSQGGADHPQVEEQQDGQVGVDMGVRDEQLPMTSGDEQEELWDSDDEAVTPTAEEFPQIHSLERSGALELREGQQRWTLDGTEEIPPLPMDTEWSRERVDITGQVSGPWSEARPPEEWRDLLPRERWGQELPGPLEVEVLAPQGPETSREVVPPVGDGDLQHQRSWVSEMKERHSLYQLPGEREEVSGENGGIEDWLRHVTAQRGARVSGSDGASESEPEGDWEAPSARREAAAESSSSSAERRNPPTAEADPGVLQTSGTVEHTEEKDGQVGVDMGVRVEQFPMASGDEQEELWDSDDEEVTPTAEEFPQIHSLERSRALEPREGQQRWTLDGTEEIPPLPMDTEWSRERVDITGQVSGPWSKARPPEEWRDLLPRERWGQELPGPLEVEVLGPVGLETSREVVPPVGDEYLQHQRSWVPEMEERHSLDQLPGENGGIEDWLRHVTAQRGARVSGSDGASEFEPEGEWEAPSARREAAAESSSSSAERRNPPTAEVDPRVLQTSGTLEHTEAKQGGEELSDRIRETAGRVRDIEKMLQHRSQNVSEAKEQQKRVWGELDRWHAVLSRLDAEVQDLAEVDPCLAQQLMDALMDSFQEHQQAARTAEQRTTLVNKIPDCLEDYRQVTESATAWIQSTQAQLSDTIDCTNGKSLGKQLFTLQVIADTNGQKQAALQEVGTKLREVGEMFDTDHMVSRVEQLFETGASLQQAVSQKAAEVEYIATEIGAIESEVKNIESKLVKVNTILTAVDIENLTAEEHLTNRQIIAENLVEMRKVAGVLSSYEHSLTLPERAAGTVQAFARLPLITGQLAELQQLTSRQSGLLESLLEKLQECDTETERLQELQAGNMEDQQERLAVVHEQRARLVRDAQEALNEVTATFTDGQRSPPAHSEQPREPESPQPATLPGKLTSLQEQDEDEDECEETMEPPEECHPSAPPQPPHAEPQQSVVGLDVCWERAAAVERELASAGERLGAGVWSAAMHHNLQDSLLQSQTALTEIEERLVCLTGMGLEQGGPELEALSQRLGSLRGSLTQLRARLEMGKPTAEELSQLCPTKEVAQQTEMMWPSDQPRAPDDSRIPAEAPTRDVYRPVVGTPADPVPGPTLQRQILDCWQQLQQETQGLQKLLEDSLQQGPEPQVFVTAREPSCVLRPAPDVEELSMWMAQLREQGQSAALLAGQTEGLTRQDAGLRLEEAVQRTAVRISEWVAAAEQMLGHCSLGPCEEALRQLDTLQVWTAALDGVHREMAEQLLVLGQADIFSCALAGRTLSTLHSNVQLLLRHCSLVSDSLRPRAEQLTSCQERLRQLQVTVSQRRAEVQQRLLESAACDTDQHLQWLEQTTVDLDSLDVELLSLRDGATRCDLEPHWLRQVEQLEETLDDTMGLVGEQQAELAHSLVMGRLYQGLMQGTASLVELGQERLAPGDRLPTGTLADLRTHLHSHKLFYRGLEDLIIRAEQISRNVPERIVAEQRVGRLELESRHKELQSQALRHGVHAETTLQCWAELEMELEVLEEMLATLSSRLSDLLVVGETARESSEGETECLHTCQEVCDGVEGSWPQMEEAQRRGEVLLRFVDSPELEDKLQTMEDAWISVRDRAHRQLYSLSTMLQLRHRIGDECGAVTTWLDAAERRLERWGQGSPDGTEGQENPNNLFLDIWTGLEECRTLQAAAVSRGKRLLALQPPGGTALQTQLHQLQHRWAHVEGQLPALQQQLQQDLRELLKVKEGELERLRQTLPPGVEPDPSGSPTEIVETLDQLQESCGCLAAEVGLCDPRRGQPLGLRGGAGWTQQQSHCGRGGKENYCFPRPPCVLLSKLVDWLDVTETRLRQSAAEETAPRSWDDVRREMHTYQRWRMELSLRQPALDLVNQTVVQGSGLGPQSDRGRSIALSEHLGALNLCAGRGWHTASKPGAGGGS
ncbi:uncharacterized protein LOC129700594 [Leucoraja erinacea]|uniref:uncharacterized protein LOC129700594 n=1 Tax=Leucoraja erinaceus TaxID=7782 RepID=UPI00245660B3|nr:uncharacterized protein LOC129700594 [Leucoraja erinacea]